jgi:hypothetical protein
MIDFNEVKMTENSPCTFCGIPTDPWGSVLFNGVGYVASLVFCEDCIKFQCMHGDCVMAAWLTTLETIAESVLQNQVDTKTSVTP